MSETSPVVSVETSTEWPNLNQNDWIAITIFNVVTIIMAYVLLRIIWPPPSKEAQALNKQLQMKISQLQEEYQSLTINEHRGGETNGNSEKSQRAQAVECLEGESAGDYSLPWTETFDLWFVLIMGGGFVVLAAWSSMAFPHLWGDLPFWLGQLPKLGVMMGVSLLGGFLCRHFCSTDEKGYIITNKDSVFKVNYTRKLQHFAAYLVPLLLHNGAIGVPSELALAWGDWFTLVGFLILIKPLRERFTFIMYQFNALDRPEDRPNTLNWIVGGNIIPGAILIVFFRWLYSYTGQEAMAYIFLFITGIGDGLAEPVGIYLGRHKYWTSAFLSNRKYQRSYEGSSCVWISSVIFTSMFYYSFASAWQFWVAMVILPPLMTYAEATSPHTLDTPFLMGLGGFTLFVISRVHVLWT